MATNTMTTTKSLSTNMATRSSKAVVSSNNEARAISISEWKEAALSIAEAFADDDVSRYFVDTPDRAHWSKEEKWNLHVNIMEYITYAHCLRGLVTTAGPNYGSIALWMPPGNNMDDWYTILRSGMWRLNYKLSAEGKSRFFSEFLPLLHDTKHAVLGARDDSSYYLVYVGTRPSARGKGWARKCIDFVTRVADEEGRACYLESSNDVNPAIYKKLGFEVVRKIALKRAKKDVVLDVMVREPNIGGAVSASASASPAVAVQIKSEKDNNKVQVKSAPAAASLVDEKMGGVGGGAMTVKGIATV